MPNSNVTEISAGIDLSTNIKDVTKEVKGFGTAFANVSAQVDDVIKHIDKLTKKTSKLNQVNHNNIKTLNQNKYYRTQNTYQRDPNSNIIIGANGTSIQTKGVSSQAFQQAAKDYHEYQQEMTALLKEEKKYVRQESDTRAKRAQAALKSSMYKSSAEHLRYENALAAKHDNLQGYYQYKNDHPGLFANGGQRRNWRVQGSEMMGYAGGLAASTNTIVGKTLNFGLKLGGAALKGGPAFLLATTVKEICKGLETFGKAVAESTVKLESLRTQLGVVTGSNSEANALMGDISAYAVKSPFGIEQTTELAILLKQSGVYASDLMSTLRMLGDTAGGNMEKMKRIANNYAQIVSIGKASMLDMRQFAYAGIPIFEAVSKELGVSQQKLRQLISEGKVTSEIVEKVFKDLTGVNGIFENATEKGAKTLAARVQNLKDIKSLAGAAFGEQFTNRIKKDPYDKLEVYKVLDFEESFFTKIKDSIDATNTAKNVEAIVNRDEHEDQLRNGIALAENRGDFNRANELRKTLEDYRKQRDLEKEAAELVKSYLMNVDKMNSLLDKRTETENTLQKYNARARGQGVTPLLTPDTAFEDQRDFITYMSVLTAGFGNFARNSKGYKDLKSITTSSLNKLMPEQTVSAYDRYYSLHEQQVFNENVDRALKKQSSVFTLSQKLTQEWENLPEQKQTEREKELKEYERIREILQKIYEFQKSDSETNEKTDEVDMRSVNYKDYLEWLKAGALTTTGYNFNDLTPKQLEEDFKQQQEALANSFKMLKSYTEDNSDLFEKNLNYHKNDNPLAVRFQEEDSKIFFKKYEKGYVDNIIGDYIKALNKSFDNPEQFAKAYQKAYTTASNRLLKTFENDQENSFYKDLLNILDIGSHRFFSDTRAKDYIIPEDEKKKTNVEPEFIPLWKRILASKTGLTAQGMTSTAQTLSNYTNDMAIRNMASGVLKATISEIGINSAMGLVSSTKKASQLRGTSDYTYQVDWAETKKNLKSFALSLSASTSVIEAYKKGLEEELSVYEDLVVAGYTEAESQDLKSQKFISTKTLARFSQDAGSQLVNAFGEVFKTKSGRNVRWGDDGQFYDTRTGNAVEEEVVLTGNLFELIKKELPRVREELHEANVASAKNKILNGTVNKNSIPFIKDAVLSMSGITAQSSFVLANIETFEPLIKSIYESKKYQDVYNKDHEFGSYEDLKMKALSSEGDFRSKEASHALTEFNTLIMKFLEELTGNNDITSIVNAMNNSGLNAKKGVYIADILANFGKKDEETLFNPLGYQGIRGLNAGFLKMMGKDLNYDMEDIYTYVDRYGWKEKGIPQGFRSSSNKDRVDELENLIDKQFAIQELTNSVKELGLALGEVAVEFGKGSWEKPFEVMTENLAKGEDITEGLGSAMKSLTANTFDAAGAAMSKAGWELVANGAATKNAGMMAVGFGLAAAGGMSKGFGSFLNSKQDNDEDKYNKSLEKLEKLKNSLSDLLKQAREDAIYYENTTQHKKAISIGKDISVNDAIITPSGNVISTHPDDYLIATKTPQSLGNRVAAPIVNIKNIDNSSGVNVKSRVNYNPASNTIDIEAVIENKVADFIASERSDMAFATREQRQKGVQYVG